MPVAPAILEPIIVVICGLCSGLTSFGDGILFHVLVGLLSNIGLYGPVNVQRSVFVVTVMGSTNAPVMLLLALRDMSWNTLSLSLAIGLSGVALAAVGVQVLLALRDPLPLIVSMGSIFLVFSMWRLTTMARDAARAKDEADHPASTPSAAASYESSSPTAVVLASAKEDDSQATADSTVTAEGTVMLIGTDTPLPKITTSERSDGPAPTDGAISTRPRSLAEQWACRNFPTWREFVAFLVTGSIAGFMGGTMGTNGPPLMALFAILNTHKDRIRAVYVPYSIAELIPRLITFAQQGDAVTDGFDAGNIAAISACALAGFLSGTFLRRYVSSSVVLVGLLHLVLISACLQIGVLQSGAIAAGVLIPLLAWAVALIAWLRCRPAVRRAFDWTRPQPAPTPMELEAP